MTPLPADGSGVVDRLLELLHARPPTLGEGRLLCIDGPAGSGKTTLAAQVAERTDAAVVHVDDLLEGWSGLPRVHTQVSPLLESLAHGSSAYWRAWDWSADRRGDERVLRPGPLVVLEGVGAGQRAWTSLTTVLVWVGAPEELRLRRGLARDGAVLREHWLQWMAAEAELFAREGTRERADLVLSTTDVEEKEQR